MDESLELLQGTLDLLILKAVSLGPTHGYGLLLRIEALSRETFRVPQGSLYPALYRLESRGLVAARWGESDNKRRAKFYRLTPAGRKELATESREWNRISHAMASILRAEPQEG